MDLLDKLFYQYCF